MSDNLTSSHYGDGPPLLVLHGLFGSGDNWRSIAKSLAKNFSVYCVDLRNHGQSFRRDTMSYQEMAADVYEFCKSHQLEDIILLGHSMGGKTAMQFAHDYPQLLKALIILDIAPKAYPPQHDDVLNGLRDISFDDVSNRTEILAVLKSHIASDMLCQFLLKSMKCQEGVCESLINIEAIDKDYDSIAAPPFFEASFETACPTLVVVGDLSNYVLTSDHVLFTTYFKNCHFMTVPKAGHWLHAEQPQFVLDIIESFSLKNI